MSKEFNRQKWDWLRAINFELSEFDTKVALALAHYFNDNNGGCAYPSIETLATDAGLSNPTVRRAIVRIKQAGFLKVIAGKRGRGHSNRYWMESAKIRRTLQALSEAKEAKEKGLSCGPFSPEEKGKTESLKGKNGDAKRDAAASLTPLDSIMTLQRENG